MIEVETCARYLREVENTWTGAQRSCLIIDELIKLTKTSQDHNKRSFADFEKDGVAGLEGLDVRFVDYNFGLDQDPFAELFRTPVREAGERFE